MAPSDALAAFQDKPRSSLASGRLRSSSVTAASPLGGKNRPVLRRDNDLPAISKQFLAVTGSVAPGSISEVLGAGRAYRDEAGGRDQRAGVGSTGVSLLGTIRGSCCVFVLAKESPSRTSVGPGRDHQEDLEPHNATFA